MGTVRIAVLLAPPALVALPSGGAALALNAKDCGGSALGAPAPTGPTS